MLAGVGVAAIDPGAARSSSRGSPVPEPAGKDEAVAPLTERVAKREREEEAQDDTHKRRCRQDSGSSSSSSSSAIGNESSPGSPAALAQDASPGASVEAPAQAASESPVSPATACAQAVDLLRSYFWSDARAPLDPARLMALAPRHEEQRLQFARLLCARINSDPTILEPDRAIPGVQKHNVWRAFKDLARSLIHLHRVTGVDGRLSMPHPQDFAALVEGQQTLYVAGEPLEKSVAFFDWLPIHDLFDRTQSPQQSAEHLASALRAPRLSNQRLAELVRRFVFHYAGEARIQAQAISLGAMTDLLNDPLFAWWSTRWQRNDRPINAGPLLTMLIGISLYDRQGGDETELWEVSGRLSVRQLSALACAIARATEGDYLYHRPGYRDTPEMSSNRLSPRKWKHLLQAMPRFPHERALLMAVCLMFEHTAGRRAFVPRNLPGEAIQALSDFAGSADASQVAPEDIQLCLLAARMVRDPWCLFDAPRSADLSSLPPPAALTTEVATSPGLASWRAQKLARLGAGALPAPRPPIAQLLQPDIVVPLLKQLLGLRGLFTDEADPPLKRLKAVLANDRLIGLDGDEAVDLRYKVGGLLIEQLPKLQTLDPLQFVLGAEQAMRDTAAAARLNMFPGPDGSGADLSLAPRAASIVSGVFGKLMQSWAFVCSFSMAHPGLTPQQVFGFVARIRESSATHQDLIAALQAEGLVQSAHADDLSLQLQWESDHAIAEIYRQLPRMMGLEILVDHRPMDRRLLEREAHWQLDALLSLVRSEIGIHYEKTATPAEGAFDGRDPVAQLAGKRPPQVMLETIVHRIETARALLDAQLAAAPNATGQRESKAAPLSRVAPWQQPPGLPREPARKPAVGTPGDQRS